MSNCKGCKFYQEVNPEQGICRRFPPLPFPVGPKGTVTSYWPAVQKSHWCGEWLPRLVIATEISEKEGSEKEGLVN